MAYQTREAWLEAAVAVLWKLLPAREDEGLGGLQVKVSVGWPKGRHGGKKAVGECWAKGASTDGTTSHIFISPEMMHPCTVLAILAHELCHVWAGTEAKHRGQFIRAMKAIGMQKPWTMSVPTPGFAEYLEGVAKDLGEYPHVGLQPKLKPKQKTRMRLYTCSHGQKVRAATDELRAECQECGTPFTRQGAGEKEEDGEE